MEAAEVRKLLDGGLFSQEELHVHERDGRLAVNDMVALPVRRDCSFPVGEDLEVLSESGNVLGVVCLTSILPKDPINRSHYALAAYLTEQEASDFSLSRPLLYDYFVIDKDGVDEYLMVYSKSAAIWGGFVHIAEQPATAFRSSSSSITAKSGLTLPLEASEALCQRAMLAAHPYERFLKHYHQLELLVDWYVAKQISQLPADLSGFEKIMSSYSAGDLTRLTSLVNAFCADKKAVMRRMDKLGSFLPIGAKMFQEFSKKGNPLGSEAAWAKWLRDGANENNALELACYWIFRVRSSIAHHRIGEYMLLDADQDFVVSFAEPLLLEMVKQVLSDEALQKLA